MTKLKSFTSINSKLSEDGTSITLMMDDGLYTFKLRHPLSTQLSVSLDAEVLLKTEKFNSIKETDKYFPIIIKLNDRYLSIDLNLVS